MKILSLVLVFGLVVLTACTGGRRRQLIDGYCFNKENGKPYNPIPAELRLDRHKSHSAKTLASSKLNKNGIGSGSYEYVSSTIYFEEKLDDSNLRNPYQRMHFRHIVTDKGENAFKTECVSNLPQDKTVGPITVPVVSEFTVEGDDTVTQKTGEFTFYYNGKEIIEEFEYLIDESEEDKKTPLEILDGMDHYFYKVDKQKTFTHELRSKAVDGNSTVNIVVRYKLADE